jgi:hypothetical protein
MLSIAQWLCGAVILTRRARVYHVKLVPVPLDKFQSVALVELERKSRLRRNVNANHIKAGTMVANGAAASATKGVE